MAELIEAESSLLARITALVDRMQDELQHAERFRMGPEKDLPRYRQVFAVYMEHSRVLHEMHAKFMALYDEFRSPCSAEEPD